MNRYCNKQEKGDLNSVPAQQSNLLQSADLCKIELCAGRAADNLWAPPLTFVHRHAAADFGTSVAPPPPTKIDRHISKQKVTKM